MVLRCPISRSLLFSGTVFLLFVGCASSGQFDSIEASLAEIQTEVRQLTDSTSSKKEVARLADRLSDNAAQLMRADADILAEVGQLSEQITELEDQLSDTLHRLDQLVERVTNTNEELRALSRAMPLRSAEGGRPPMDTSDPEALYNSGYSEYQRGNYRLAILGFGAYLEAYADRELADNALYWMGESYFSQRRFSQAIGAFSDLLTRHPGSDKVASARLLRGFSYLERGEHQKGVGELRDLIRERPSSAEASLAQEELTKLEALD